MKLLDEVLKEIKPSAQEEKAMRARTKGVLARLGKALPDCKVILGGSGEKGTWLRETHDFDIFVMFPKKKYMEKSDQLSIILEKKIKNLYKIKKLHGSRDYFQTVIDKFTFEIVPILETTKANSAVNITDVSPLHAKWVKKYKKYADDIRLTKQFFKAGKIYGAESYINGFSGYVCEILTINYKGFYKLVRAIVKWKSKQVIDIINYHKGKNVLFELDKAKTVGPLIIIDPVQASRNAAAAVAKEKFDEAIKYAKAFISKPSVKYFRIRYLDWQTLKKKAGRDEFYEFEVKSLTGKEDVVGCKLLKSFEHIKRKLDANEFIIKFSDWEWNKTARFYFIIKNMEFSKYKILKGPPSKMKFYALQFKKKHKNVFEEKKYLMAKEKRKYTKARVLLTDLLKDKYIKEKVRSILLK